MSFAFSRRSFLKYTAVAAVAVSGASLFTGCKIDTSDSYNALRTTPGELTVLQVTAAMGYVEASKSYTAPDVKGTTIVFPFKITNGRANPIYVNPNNFKATVLDAEGKVILAKYTASNGLSLEPSLCDTNLKKDASVSGKVTLTLAPDATHKAGQSIVLTYCPDLQYNEYSLNWKTTRAKD